MRKVRRILVLSVFIFGRQLRRPTLADSGLRRSDSDMGVGGAAGRRPVLTPRRPAAPGRHDPPRPLQMEGGFLGLYVDSKFDVKTRPTGQRRGNAGYFSPAGTCITCTASARI